MTDLERIELLFRRIQDSPEPPRDVGELVDYIVILLADMNKNPKRYPPLNALMASVRKTEKVLPGR
jgi:hypothetical protein